MTAYEAIIGMELHVQLHTRSKMFCCCAVVADTGDVAPNTYVCPVCTGMPGMLPVINRQAVEYAVMAGLALNCKIARHTLWERKSYWYPDLPKNYQISQYQFPLSYEGWIEIEPEGAPQRTGGRVPFPVVEELRRALHLVAFGKRLVELEGPRDQALGLPERLTGRHHAHDAEGGVRGRHPRVRRRV